MGTRGGIGGVLFNRQSLAALLERWRWEAFCGVFGNSYVWKPLIKLSEDQVYIHAHIRRNTCSVCHCVKYH